MSLSDLLNISQTARRDKARAQDLLPTPTTSSALTGRLCNICYNNQANYNCPRCNTPYCSLACFRKREHDECSKAFSSSALNVAKKEAEGLTTEVDDGGRKGVVEILARLEGQERETKERRNDTEDSDEDDDENVGLRADVTEEEVEGASTEELLAMLSDKDRRKFMDAVKHPESAAQLMHRLERKADQRARSKTLAEPQQQRVLIQSELTADHKKPKNAAKRGWQSTPWFETSDGCPSLSSRTEQHVSGFVATLEKILASQSKTEAPAPVNLVYNLCAVLMAYTYTLRRLDVASLSEISRMLVTRRGSQASSTIPAATKAPQRKAQPTFETPGEDDDDEPPPLEPDEPISQHSATPPFLMADPAPAPVSKSQILEATATAVAAMDNLARLFPFFFPQPTPSQPIASNNDPSKLLLSSVDDASLYLLSRLSIDTEIVGGADALNLQLLQDLAQLLTAEQLIPTFSSEDEAVESRYQLVARLVSLPAQQSFAAAQTPLLLNAVADLYLFFEDLISLSSSPESKSFGMRMQVKSIKLAQRKLCFYLCSAVLGDLANTARTTSRLREELELHVARLQQQIDSTEQADQLAAAINLLNNSNPATSI